MSAVSEFLHSRPPFLVCCNYRTLWHFRGVALLGAHPDTARRLRSRAQQGGEARERRELVAKCSRSSATSSRWTVLAVGRSAMEHAGGQERPTWRATRSRRRVGRKLSKASRFLLGPRMCAPEPTAEQRRSSSLGRPKQRSKRCGAS